MSSGIEIFSLQNKIALVTGATGYLGRAMVQILAEAGALVLVNGRNEERVSTLVKEICEQGLKAESAVFDITDETAIKNYFTSLNNKPLDVLINNAYFGSSGNIKCSKAGAYIDSHNVTVVASHNLLTNALPHLRQAVDIRGDASIINLASMYGMVSPDQRIYETEQAANPPFYGAAKAAFIQWTRYAACEFGKEKIRVNSISPGAFPSIDVQKTNPEFISKLENKIPMGRIGQANELQGSVLFLASSASSYVSGSNLVVDGGWTCW